MTMANINEQLHAVLNADKGWMSSGAIWNRITDCTKDQLNAAIAQQCKNGTLQKRMSSIGHEYAALGVTCHTADHAPSVSCAIDPASLPRPGPGGLTAAQKMPAPRGVPAPAQPGSARAKVLAFLALQLQPVSARVVADGVQLPAAAVHGYLNAELQARTVRRIAEPGQRTVWQRIPAPDAPVAASAAAVEAAPPPDTAPPPAAPARHPRRTPAEIDSLVLAALAVGPMQQARISAEHRIASQSVFWCLQRLKAAGKVTKGPGRYADWQLATPPAAAPDVQPTVTHNGGSSGGGQAPPTSVTEPAGPRHGLFDSDPPTCVLANEASCKFALWSTGELELHTGDVDVVLPAPVTRQLIDYLDGKLLPLAGAHA